MRVGLLARAEDRGLGIQSWEFHRGMTPDATVVVDMGELARGYPMHPDRFPGAPIAAFDGHRFTGRHVDTVRDMAAAVDVIYTAETCYDWRLPEWCDEAGTGLAIHANPEFYGHAHPRNDRPHPTAWWAPTSWLLDRLPDGTTVVPVPAPLHLFPTPVAAAPDGGELRWLHVVGHRATGDRNGTTLMLQAARRLQPCTVTCTTQGDALPQARGYARGVTVTYDTDGSHSDRAELYAGHHGLVLPRRYGGLCLPALEALAAGLVVVMPGCSPNEVWPGPRPDATKAGSLRTHVGRIPMMAVNVPQLAGLLDGYRADPEALARHQLQAREWAEVNDWEALRPTYVRELEVVAELASSR